MKSFIVILTVCFAFGCNTAVKPVVQNTNTPAASKSLEKAQTAIAHSSENPAAAPPATTGGASKWTQSGDPIDTTSFDAAIMSAEKAVSAKSGDQAAKKALAAAYLKRAVALTQARQYASALGDYRRTLKYDPTNEEAKGWVKQIVDIYSSINRASPPEGEEPPPLEFKKGK